MMNAMLAQDHRLWGQIIQKEQVTKKRFEFLTGQTQAKNFFSGTMRGEVDNKLSTWDKTMQARKPGHKAFLDVSLHQNADTASKAMKGTGRYSNKAEALSKGFADVISGRKEKRTTSLSLAAKPRCSDNLPLRREGTDS